MKDSGAFLESRFAGLTRVEIQCTEKEIYDFANYTWGYQVEALYLDVFIHQFGTFFIIWLSASVYPYL